MIDVMVTLWRPYANSAAVSAVDREHLTSYGAAYLKECNYLWSANDQIRQDCGDTRRGPADPLTGVPTGANVVDADLPDTEFQIRIGATAINEIPVKGGELIYHNKMTLGLESMRSSFSNPLSYNHNKRFYSFNLEKFTGTALDNAGESLRDGVSLQVIFKDAGTAGLFGEKMFFCICATQQSLSWCQANSRF